MNAIGLALLWVSGILTVLLLLVIIAYILVQGLPVINWEFLTQNPISRDRRGGIYPTIVATVLITAIAALVSTPVSVAAAIYMAEYAGESRISNLVRFGADSLAGIPSIIFGLFGYIMFVHYFGWNYSLIAGSNDARPHGAADHPARLRRGDQGRTGLATSTAAWPWARASGRRSGRSCCRRQCRASSRASSLAWAGRSARRPP